MLGALAVLPLTLLAICNRIDERRRGSVLPVRGERRSDPAHDIVVETLDGGRQILRAPSGRFQLIHFWATWCLPCRTELPAILDLARRNHGRLPTGEGARIHRVTGLPDSYLIDPDGHIRARFSGAQDWNSPEMDRILRALILKS